MINMGTNTYLLLVVCNFFNLIFYEFASFNVNVYIKKCK